MTLSFHLYEFLCFLKKNYTFNASFNMWDKIHIESTSKLEICRRIHVENTSVCCFICNSDFSQGENVLDII